MLEDLKHAQDHLEQSEEKYRSLFENSLDGIYTSTIDGKYIDANQALIDMLCYDSKEQLMSINIPKQLYWNEKDRPAAENRNKIFETVLKERILEPLGMNGRFTITGKGNVINHPILDSTHLDATTRVISSSFRTVALYCALYAQSSATPFLSPSSVMGLNILQSFFSAISTNSSTD